MKNFTIFFSLLLIIKLTNMFGQSAQRQQVVFEIATGVNEPYSPAAANGVHQMLEEGLQIAVVKYHTSAFSIPQFYTTETIARVSWYGINSYPTTKVDGILTQIGGGGASSSNYSVYMPLYNQRIAVQSPFTIDLSWENSGGDSYIAHATITKVGSTSSTNMKFVLALAESEINYNWQGMTQLDDVCRDMIPDQNGSPLDFSVTNTITLDLPFTWNSTWVRNNCELIGFVQDFTSKEILQGTKKSMNAPSFELYHEGVLLPEGSVITIPGEPSSPEILVEVSVKNISSLVKNVKLSKQEIVVVPQSFNYFCWGLCYGGNIYVSPYPLTINPGQMNDEFSGHYQPSGTSGATQIKYTFFDELNTNDNVFFIAKYSTLNPPLNLQAEIVSQHDVFLTWDSPEFENAVNSELLGYNIYRNENKINSSLIQETTFTDFEVPVGIHGYFVTAEYPSGESANSNFVFIEIQNSTPANFLPIWSSPYNPMTFYILEATIDEINLESGAEVGIFDTDPNTGEEICVGAGVIVEPLTSGNYLEIIASMDDGSLVGQANGFTPGHEIIYKLWSEVTGETSTVQANYPYPGYDEVFASQGSAFAELNGFTTITQDISLQTGWNLMSFRVEPENWNMLQIVQPLIDQGVLYKVLNETGGSIFHLPFPPPNGQWSNTIGNMANTEGYYVKVTGDGNLSLEGYPVETPMDIPLTTGWNIISYPCEFPESALTAVQPLIDAGVLYKVIDEAGGSIFHLPFPPPNGQWSNTIGNFESGEGYYVKVTGNANLNISCPADGSDALPEIPAKQQTQFFQPVWDNNPYMPMHVVVLPNEAFTAGDEIGVFDGEICVGATVYDGNSENPIIIVASMDDPETEILDGATAGHSFSIASWKNISGIVFEDIEYAIVEGSSTFSGLETSIIETKILTGIFSNPDLTNPGSFSIHPNPCDQQTSINFYMPFNGVVEIGFYHPTGKATGFSVTKHFEKGQQSVLTENLTISPGLYLVKIDFRSETGFLQHFGKLIKR